MSVKIMGLVWDAPLERDEKFILLAYADHADHDGGSIFPSKERMARMTGYSLRSVQTITAAVLKAGLMREDGKGAKGVIRYRINVDLLQELAWGYTTLDRGAQILRGAENDAEGCRKQQKGGADSAPNPSKEPPEDPSPEAQGGVQDDLFNPSPSPAPSELPPELAQNAELVAAWEEWKAHRKQLRHAMTPISTKKQVAEMVQWGPARSVAAIHHSIKQGYRGLFEPKTGKTLPPRGPITAENVLSLPKKQ